ncbi:MAG: hypothetical protein ACLVB5_00740 [Christensenellales bacterium]
MVYGRAFMLVGLFGLQAAASAWLRRLIGMPPTACSTRRRFNDERWASRVWSGLFWPSARRWMGFYSR